MSFEDKNRKRCNDALNQALLRFQEIEKLWRDKGTCPKDMMYSEPNLQTLKGYCRRSDAAPSARAVMGHIVAFERLTNMKPEERVADLAGKP